MSITKKINEYTNKYNIIQTNKDVYYEDYLDEIINEYYNKSKSYFKYGCIDDIISIIGWNTSKSGLLELIYTSFSESLPHGAKIHYKHGMQTALHNHNHIELAYVVQGKLCQNINGKTEIFSKNEICLIDNDSLHTDILLNENSTVLFLGIDSNFFDEFFNKKDFKHSIEQYIIKLIAHKKDKYEFIRFQPIKNPSQTKKTFEILLDELFNNNPCRSQIIKVYIERLLHLLPLEYRFSLSRKEQNELSNILLQDIKRHINDNIKTISVQNIAVTFNYNPDYLSKLCYRKTGKTLSQTIVDLRMIRAHSLLKTTDYSITHISNIVGYKNVGFFYKKFKEKYFTYPNDIRKESKV